MKTNTPTTSYHRRNYIDDLMKQQKDFESDIGVMIWKLISIMIVMTRVPLTLYPLLWISEWLPEYGELSTHQKSKIIDSIIRIRHETNFLKQLREAQNYELY